MSEMKMDSNQNYNMKNQGGFYSLVIAVAKRAREIVDNHEHSSKTYTIKPVKLAENEIMNGKYKIIIPDSVPEEA